MTSFDVSRLNAGTPLSTKRIDKANLPCGSAFHPAGIPFRSKRQRPSFYADPASWLILQAFEQALEQCSQDFLARPEQIGLITLSETCTLHTMLEIEKTLGEGVISPLRFSGANPGAVGSLPSHFFGFSGPTLVLSMPPEDGLDLAATLAAGWLAVGDADFVAINRHWLTASGHYAESTIFAHEKEVGQWRD